MKKIIVKIIKKLRLLITNGGSNLNKFVINKENTGSQGLGHNIFNQITKELNNFVVKINNMFDKYNGQMNEQTESLNKLNKNLVIVNDRINKLENKIQSTITPNVMRRRFVLSDEHYVTGKFSIYAVDIKANRKLTYGCRSETIDEAIASTKEKRYTNLITSG